MKNSTKVILAVFMLFAATVSANAQFDNNRQTKRFHMGLHAGGSINSYTGGATEYMDPITSFTGGVNFDFQIAPVPVYIGFDLNYLNLGYKYTYRSSGKRYDANCFNLPVYVGYHFNVAPNFFISPHVGYSMSYLVDDWDKSNYDWDNNRFNSAVRFGCGFNFGRLTFDLSYDLGLKNWGSSKKTSYTRTFFATIGVNLAGCR